MRLLRRLNFTMLLMSMMTLVACGGDGGDLTGGSDGGGTPEAVTLTIAKSDGDLSAANNITVSATVLDDGSPVANKTVTFSLAVSGSAVFSPVAGTATTDVNGIATIIANVTDMEGSVNVIASYESATDNISFNSAGDGSEVGGSTLTITSFSNSTAVANATPGVITVHFEQADGSDLNNEVITFTSTLGLLDPTTGTVLTNGTGDATITLSAGTVRGAGVLTAVSSSGIAVTQGFFTEGDGSEVGGSVLTITSFTNSTSVANATPSVITVHFEQADGTDLSNEVITFTSTLGLLDPTTGTVLTNSTGDATITLSAGTVRGAGVLTATTGSGIAVTQGFFTEGDGSEVGGSVLTITSFTNSTSVANATPSVITVHFEQADGTDLSNEVITFTSTLGLLDPTTGTVLTNSTGDATITLSAGTVRGAAVLTAVSSLGTAVTQGFFTEGDSVGSGVNISIVLTDTNGAEIDQISSILPGKLTATVTGVTKAVIVNFITDLGSIPIPTAIATTGSGYIATVDLLSGNALGAGTVTAQLASGETEQLVFSIGASSLAIGNAIVGATGFPDGLVGVPGTAISAGATAGLSVSIWDVSSATPATPATLFATETVEVTFTSGCSGLTTPKAIIDSPVSTVAGVAQSTYLAQGCEGNDIVTATANAGGIVLSASGTVTVSPADTNSIEFVSATPENISLQGVGGTESSNVIFRVLDSNGNPAANEDINFSLNTFVGGVSINPTSATTDSNGLVRTVVNSGTVHTTVRVRAEVNGSSPLIFTQSNLLVISTGIPDQDSFSLSTSVFNPEAWNIDGTEVTITARLADAFNNPAPDGTAVAFTTEGGSIDPSCVTLNGKCEVIWRSQFPRPEGKELLIELQAPDVTDIMGQKYGGRATILATAIGEESFPDFNGNGQFDMGEMAAFTGNNISGKPYDLKEAFVDHNEDDLYNPSEGSDVNSSGALEEFIDFNSSTAFDGKDLEYNGSLCGDATNCSPEKSINVRGSLVLVMSGSNPEFVTTAPAGGADIVITGENSISAAVTIADLHNQPMPAGTTVEFDAAVGSIVGPSSYIWPNFNKNGGSSFAVTVKGVKTDALNGPLTVTVTTPTGVTTSYIVAAIDLN